ncbi:MAG: hypothetical protein KGL39_53490 [Patescibacteria group bacterium]|nr:hypothetical protein [Patescibacteria group bacterium]
MGDNLSSVVLASQAVNLVMGLVGFGAFYGLARFLDWNTGRKVSAHLDIIEGDAKALALYRGLRLFGLFYFIAALLK